MNNNLYLIMAFISVIVTLISVLLAVGCTVKFFSSAKKNDKRKISISATRILSAVIGSVACVFSVFAFSLVIGCLHILSTVVYEFYSFRKKNLILRDV